MIDSTTTNRLAVPGLPEALQQVIDDRASQDLD